MPTEHIVKAYDDELKQLSNMISRMGGLAENQVAMAIEAVVRRDNAAATETIQSDEKVDQLEHEVDQFCVRLLALRQPMAGDLRRIIGALKIASDLERIADYGANVAKRALQLNQIEPVKPLYAIPRMGKLAQEMIKDVLDAFAESDVDKALDVWHRDEEVDEMYTSLFRELLTYMMEDPRNITACTHLLFIAKNIERVGDHATNIAETIHFLVRGGPFSQGRRQTHDGSVLIGLDNEVKTS